VLTREGGRVAEVEGVDKEEEMEEEREEGEE
jgi:hypothetical protein